MSIQFLPKDVLSEFYTYLPTITIDMCKLVSKSFYQAAPKPKNRQCFPDKIVESIKLGHIDVLKWLDRSCYRRPMIEAIRTHGWCCPCSIAAMYNRIDIMKWLHTEKNHVICKSALEKAFTTDALASLLWINTNSIYGIRRLNDHWNRPRKRFIYLAILYGSVNILKWYISEEHITKSELSAEFADQHVTFSHQKLLEFWLEIDGTTLRKMCKNGLPVSILKNCKPETIEWLKKINKC